MRRQFYVRLRSLWRWRRQEAELEEEIRFHLAEEMEERIAAGMSPEEAQAAARRDFGNVPLIRELTRETWGWGPAERLLQDLRGAFRMMRRNPTFTAVATGALALAIGVNVVMFSVLNTVLFQPLPYRVPDALVMLWTETPSQDLRENRSAFWNIEEWRRQSRSFSDLAAFDSVALTLTHAGETQRVHGARVSPNLFPLLGVQPLHGRSFSAGEAAEQRRLAVISHRFWQARFGGSLDALGASVELDGHASRIVGVLPDGFGFASLDADVFEPHTLFPDWEARRLVRGRDSWFVIGRLRPDVTVEGAQAEMSTVARRLDAQTAGGREEPRNSGCPAESSRGRIAVPPGAVDADGGSGVRAVDRRGQRRQPLAGPEPRPCAGRGSAGGVGREPGPDRAPTPDRERDAGCGRRGARHVAGGGRPRSRSFAGRGRAGSSRRGASGCWRARLVAGSVPADGGRRRVGSSTTVARAPAALWRRRLARRRWRNRRADHPANAPGGRGGPGDHAAGGRRSPGSKLVAGRGSRSRLPAGTGPGDADRGTGAHGPCTTSELLSRCSRTHRVSAGRGAGRLHQRRFHQQQSRADAHHRTRRRGRVRPPAVPQRRDQRRAVPGARHAPARRTLLCASRRSRVAANGHRQRRAGAPSVAGRRCGGEAFQVGGSRFARPLVDRRRRGRGHAPARAGDRADAADLPAGCPEPVRVGIPHRSRRGDEPLDLAAAVQAAVRQLDPRAPLYGVSTLESRLRAFYAPRGFQTSIVAGFAAAALLMAAIGIYGLIQYAVSTRTKEIAVRMAVGADTGRIFRMVVGEGLALSGAGVALGLLGGVWVGHAVRNLLFGVGALDPATFAAGSALLLAVALAACYLPARRAMRVEPIVALRQD